MDVSEAMIHVAKDEHHDGKPFAVAHDR
jgi:hypothetical protein